MSRDRRQRGDAAGNGPEWFDAADAESGKPGLRFSCTMCGNCCSGPPGYVSFTEDEAAAIAARLGISLESFMDRYTHQTPAGRSLREVPGQNGLDCVFLDRQSMPGKAICGIYEDRPTQCRTWPFWEINLRSKRQWEQARRTCPGMGHGTPYTPLQIRAIRDRDRDA